MVVGLGVEAKWGALYGCEAFVLPSHQENFGIAVVEALACGKPVLISDQVNIWREIADGEAGLVAKDTVEGTRRLLIEWELLTAEKKKKMVEQTKKVYAQYFSIEKSATNIKALIEQNLEVQTTAV
ncbi:glycosyltransferase [Runella sp. MFBS21]|uniref:glycosyltransferase n=1 Tax=Runella sp. MFBS21 TaxID=3034018 RepID=UPI0023F8732E|nr:glycosyltransferase [Runella sp. MFBS21]MDF7820412.1 glycosyltransferase [Runella sp. MFBS21]